MSKPSSHSTPDHAGHTPGAVAKPEADVQRPEMQRPDTEAATEYSGNGQTTPREDKPGNFGPQDDSPQVLSTTKETKVIKSSGDRL